jgi:ABC-type multidrug transport system ATPase subunit
MPHPSVDLIDLSPISKQTYEKLSGGWKQRVNLYLARAHGPELAFLDEPESSLDEASIRIVTQGIRARSDAGQTTLIATHDGTILEQAPNVVSLSEGPMMFQGTLDALRLQRIDDGVLEITLESEVERNRLTTALNDCERPHRYTNHDRCRKCAEHLCVDVIGRLCPTCHSAELERCVHNDVTLLQH